MLHPVLFSSDSGHVVVVDVPTSISWAEQTCHRLHSVVAIATPFETPDPKGKKLERLREAIPRSERDYRRDVEATIDKALTEARQRIPSTRHSCWCFPRATTVNASLATTPRDYEYDNDAVTTATPPLILSPQENNVEHFSVIQNTLVHNPNSKGCHISAADSGRFYIPPHSTFLWSNIQQGSDTFLTATQTLMRDPRLPEEARITFDVIVMDPPWSNRSVRKSKAYHTAEIQEVDPFWQTLPIIQQCRASQGYVAVWITNKVKIREQVTKAFAALSLYLTEEWIWVKITADGEPVMPLDGIWRKPYELLLLFGNQESTATVIRRVIIGVPDLHSRKPSLKFMFDKMLPAKYRGLEIFARNLTSTWWSWGDEVLKFQHESCWQSEP